MDSADHAMRLAMATRVLRPAKTTRKLYARDERSLRGWLPRENGTLPDRLSFLPSWIRTPSRMSAPAAQRRSEALRA